MNALPNPILTSSDADNIFCAGTSVTFAAGGGTSYNFRVGGVSVQSGASATYTTSSLSNNQVVDVIVTNANGCTATSTGITNTVNALPAANAGTGGSECDLNFKFNALASIGTGTWTLTSGTGTATFAPDANTATATVTVSEYGTYTFTWTEVSGICSNSSTIAVNFYQQPVANAGTGGNNCGLRFNLLATPSYGVGTWTITSGPGNATFSPDQNTPNASVVIDAFGTYELTWTEVDGTCSDHDSIVITFFEIPVANAGTGGEECDMDFALNAIPGNGTGTWTLTSGPGNATFTPDQNQPDATVTVDQYGTYDFVWTEVNVTCQSIDMVRVVFHALPPVSAGRDTIICKDESVQLQANGEGIFLWEPAAMVNDPNISDPDATLDSTTIFKVTLTDQYGCINSDEVEVAVWEQPVANAGPDQVLENLFGTTMEAELGINETGTWSVFSGTGEFFDSTYPATTVSNLSLNENGLIWTVTNEVCPVSSDTVFITVNNLVIPTLITPNMDGRNDYFVLRGIETLGKTELIIFDRRGAQVYKNSNYDNGWDGVDYNGNPLPDDTYFFIMKTGNGKSIGGYIVIRR
nr:T9SS type B sorting domain-containing protein [Bacteroidota bacterium]